MNLAKLAIATLLTPVSCFLIWQGKTLAETNCIDCQPEANPEIIQPEKIEWTQFEHTEGKFSIMMPEAPTQKEAGQGYSFTVEGESGLFTVAYADFPEIVNQETPDKILTDVTAGLLQNSSRVIKQENINLSGYPGREIQFEAMGGLVTGISRVYLVGERLYFILTIAEAQTDANTFLNSFKIIP